MSKISTHVLDTALGKPAAGVHVKLEQLKAYDEVRTLAEAMTDSNGRVASLLNDNEPLEAGRYRLTFDSGAYFLTTRRETLYPSVVVTFEVRDAGQHYHVPLLLSPFGYSTYRGS